MLSKQSLGKIVVIQGPMFSGKTRYLINIAEDCEIFKKPYLAIKLPDDNRYSSKNELAAMSGETAPAAPITMEQANIYLLAHPEIKILLVDEAQFAANVVEYALLWKERGIAVYCAGLNGSFEQTYFERIAMLSLHADKVKVLQGCCMFENCGNVANYSDRINPNDKELKSIGGREAYRSLCLTHLLHVQKQRANPQ